ncbi:endoplasmic reticulum mannosyl-oligosaccharide 1,2-alpha-mannosidase [Verticillium alfalfae VaMs.102]|uniref:alpha-1,2-Mannosidase n=1 Tax=Verticillium alfalfae (strain VaMs.102 / ATCC MYA-4576 / FGSC 10136) TaxID=526221 RepID=C9SGL5_VERA1|nr:endoplasmic reticulum mannosyl-oligosaccharide 1,2-alpha-mannosidase [Verticillium alfalfae VaMs.102]EEY17532.1 endoplasmic reticulum mannosyl-oligosaccharide 1,2-alpha-mannosidase [Verticillium alfalfae VaMs.102]
MVRRRSRVVLLVAVAIVFLLYRVFQNSDWDPARAPTSPKTNIPAGHSHPVEHPFEDEHEQNPIPPAAAADQKADSKPAVIPDADTNPLLTPGAGDAAAVPEPGPKPVGLASPPADDPPRDDPFRDTTKTGPALPEPDTGKPEKSDQVLHPEDIRIQKPPSRQPQVTDATDAAKTQIHWHKQTEHFPVPTESIIPLPTGKPKPFPKIQHVFTPETEAAAVKETRQKRLALVKAEAKRSWDGYRKFAWTHDELSPVSERFRDPFCGWAATLVDALDTLWIMGLKDEFKEAAEAVADIDFTYSDKRRDIPVFETIIRYLGGLLAAYDVSGGHDGDYPVLLNKATELAEILMGVFDTPNRMPILYYNWMPDFASQPHRAGSGSIAEIASMSMEFTERGTSIPGIFPENLDISGCNKTATAARNALAEEKAEMRAKEEAAKLHQPQGYVPGQDSITATDPAAEPEDDDGSALPKVVAPAAIKPADDAPPAEKESAAGSQTAAHEELAVGDVPASKWSKPAGGTPNAPEDPAVARRALRVDPAGDVQAELDPNQKEKNFLTPDDLPSYPGSTTGDERSQAPIAADGKFASWDCIEQGIVPSGYGYEQYSMGGSPGLGYLDPSAEYRDNSVKEWEEKQAQKKIKQAAKPAEDDEQGQLRAQQEERRKAEAAAAVLDEPPMAPAPGIEAGATKEMFNDDTPRRPMPVDDEVMIQPNFDDEVKLPDFDDIKVPEVEAPVVEAPVVNIPVEEVPVAPAGDAHEEHIHAKRAPPPVEDPSNPGTIDTLEPKQVPPTDNTQNVAGGVIGQIPIDDTTALTPPAAPATIPELPDPKPMNHEDPEAIESVWYMYRITGDPIWQEKGWRMFEAVVKATATSIGNSAIEDVTSTQPTKTDEMESFWLAETLKYFYLLFADTDVISLDDWVLNTEAHPFRRPKE